MSLRAFHIVFIFLSIALSAGFGFWEYRINANTAFATLSFLLSALLTAYLFWFISKIKKASHP